jgi:hypothetical protein
VIQGSAEVGAIVQTPFASQPGPVMLKKMVSASGSAFAAVIASRRVHSVTSHPPVPGSAVLLTMKSVALAVLMTWMLTVSFALSVPSLELYLKESAPSKFAFGV